VVPPCSDRMSRVPPYSRTCNLSTRTGLSPTMANLSRLFRFLTAGHWPSPRSLATTSGVSVDVLSSGYLDVSVPRVRLARLCIQRAITLRWGFPIRKSADQRVLAPPHGLSQRATSFIASQCQGIHQMPLLRLIALARRDKPLPTSRKKQAILRTLSFEDTVGSSRASHACTRQTTDTQGFHLGFLYRTYSH
jgi:hypothetical protein